MTEFENKREKYLDKLRKNPDLLESLVEGNNNNPITVELLVDPQNERQLETAELIFTQMKDVFSIVEAAVEGELKEIPVDENVAVLFLAELIKNIANNDEEAAKELLDKFNDPKYAALYVFHLTAGPLSNPEEMMEKMEELMDISFDDPIQMIKYKLYMAKASQLSNKNKNMEKNLSDEDIEYLRVYVSEFNRLCDETIIKEETENDIHKEYIKDDDLY